MRGLIDVKMAAALVALTTLPAVAAPVQWNGHPDGQTHYYEYVSTPLSWHNALTDAAAHSFLGLTGYLATITCQEEQDFVRNNTTWALAWIGASDEETEGVWKWMAGPENGTVFYQSGVGTLTYSFWNPGEPSNQFSAEDYALMNWGSNGQWNDGSDAGIPLGYILEYSVPEPMSLSLFCLGAALLLSPRRKP